MKIIFIAILTSMISYVESQIPHPSTDQNFYLDTRYSDEFDGTTLNTSMWRTDGEIWNISTPKEIISTSRIENIQVADGKLYLSSSNIPYLGHPYTQGLIDSRIYPSVGCYFETYSKLANSKYEASGFWTYDGIADAGPFCSYREIDILEYTGFAGTSTANLHYAKDEHRTAYPEWSYEVGDKSIYHKFATLWESRAIYTVLDGKNIKEKNTIYTLNLPMKIVLHGAIDFHLITDPDGSPAPTFPITYTTEYVRVYRLHCDVSTDVVEIPNFSTFYYAVKKSIKLSGATIVPAASNISLRANEFIELYPGFEVPNGTEFSMNTNGCN